jgi:hypothetical protein
MSFVNKASMHQWCDLVFETMDGPTNQQESHTINRQAWESRGKVTLECSPHEGEQSIL